VTRTKEELVEVVVPEPKKRGDGLSSEWWEE